MSDEKATYEGMFLVDAGNPDFEAASEPIRAVLERHEAKALAIKPWDERRLAYEIRGRRRGLYVLSYFEADPLQVADLEHDCQLDERIIRLLVLRRDDLTDEIIHGETPASGAAKKAAERKGDQADSEQGQGAKKAKRSDGGDSEGKSEDKSEDKSEGPREPADDDGDKGKGGKDESDDKKGDDKD